MNMCVLVYSILDLIGIFYSLQSHIFKNVVVKKAEKSTEIRNCMEGHHYFVFRYKITVSHTISMLTTCLTRTTIAVFFYIG